jgi:hypothetical protein
MTRGVPKVVVTMKDRVGEVKQLLEGSGDATLKDALAVVSQKHGVKVAALKAAYHRAQAPKDKVHGGRGLTDVHEAGLLAAAVAFSRNGRPLGLKQLRNAAAGLLSEPPSRGVLRGFLRRNKKILKKRKTKSMSSDRNSLDLLDEFEKYADALTKIQDLVPFNKELTVTADEVSIYASDDGTFEFVEAGAAANKGEFYLHQLPPPDLPISVN